jgi:hypothetical protein
MPVHEGDQIKWMQEFEAAWALLPPTARYVRLGWCGVARNSSIPPSHAGIELITYAQVKGNQFRLTQNFTGDFHRGWYDPGGCTHAYAVHKKIIPQLLSYFPCNCALDCCLSWRFFTTPNTERITQNPVMYNMDTQLSPDEAWRNSVELAKALFKKTGQARMYLGVLQFGVFQQDWITFPDGTTNPVKEKRSLLDGSLAVRGLSPRPAPRLDAAKPGPVPVCPAGTSCDHECAKEYDGYDGKTCANAAEGYCCKAAQTEFSR